MTEEREYRIIAGKQLSDDWQKLREGNITGSVAKQVKGTGSAFLYETLAMMTTKREKKQAYGEHIERGIELEPEARAEYEKATGRKVTQVMYIENGRYGISPDGVVFKNVKKQSIDRLIEIKSPDTNNHIRYIIENRIPAEHRDQIIHAFVVVDDLDELDFVSYCPVFKFKPLHIITVRRADLIMDISTTRIQYETFISKLDAAYNKLIS